MKAEKWLMVMLAVGVLLTTACRQQTTEPQAPPAGVKANPAYTSNFGSAPVSDEGTCFARVGYYPLREQAGKLQAVPFFLFNEQTELTLLLQRLVDNPADYLERGALNNPFPPGSTLQVGSRGATLELALSVPGSPSSDQLAEMAASLTETATQYPDVQRVRLQFNGSSWPGMPEEGFRSDPTRIVPPGEPQLLLVVGSWEPGAAGPDEILADFDRPVTVDSFRLSDAQGRKVDGEYFTGAFDMAVVIHPKEPASFSEGMPLQVAWEVTDNLGRSGRGEGRYMLQRHDHPLPTSAE